MRCGPRTPILVPMAGPLVVYSTPRKLPRASTLTGRVVVLDLAFASDAGGGGFEKVTKRFIDDLGDRLAMWIDHHDHQMHAAYRDDPRFVLRTKAQHGACPELVTPERVAAAGRVDTICCHGDFDGLCSAAKWLRGGQEPYPDADADARAIDTRIGVASERATIIDRALRARPRDHGLFGLVVRFLAEGGQDRGLYEHILEASADLKRLEAESRRLALGYRLDGDIAVVDARERNGSYDKTLLLMIGQERAPIAVVHDESTVTAAARYDSGIDLLALLGISGGMPTRVSVAAKNLDQVIEALRRRGAVGAGS